LPGKYGNIIKMNILNFLEEKKFKETQKFLAINLPATIDLGIIPESFLNINKKLVQLTKTILKRI
jgi:hypothetical protein